MDYLFWLGSTNRCEKVERDALREAVGGEHQLRRKQWIICFGWGTPTDTRKWSEVPCARLLMGEHQQRRKLIKLLLKIKVCRVWLAFVVFKSGGVGNGFELNVVEPDLACAME